MALIKEYEIPGTGLSAANAYFVVTDVKVHKRMHDYKTPVDTSDPTGYTNGGVWDEGTEVHWKAGYIGHIYLTIWASKEARENGQKPIGMAGVDATEVEAEVHIGTKGLDHRCVFFVDVDSADNYITQAYTYLKTLDYFEGATED